MLDLSHVLASPDLAGQPFTLVRRPRAVGEDGRAAIGAYPVPMAGSVQPAPAREMARLPDEDRHLAGIMVFTAAPVHVGGPDHAPDLIVWRGATYTVRSVRDWSQFGGAHFEALAVLEPVQGAAPPA